MGGTAPGPMAGRPFRVGVHLLFPNSTASTNRDRNTFGDRGLASRRWNSDHLPNFKLIRSPAWTETLRFRSTTLPFSSHFTRM